MSGFSPAPIDPSIIIPPVGSTREVALLFLRLGFTTFGGPAAHIAMVEDQVVNRRKWLDRSHFLDMLAAVNLIPGPNSTQLVIQLGLHRAGLRGMIASGVCFITPAALIILPLAWLYVTYGAQPNVGATMRGINACVVALLANAFWRFAKTGIKNEFTLVVAVVGAVLDALADPDIARRLLTLADKTAVFSWSPAIRLVGVFSSSFSRMPADLIIMAGAALAGIIWHTGSKQRAMPLLVFPVRLAMIAATLPALSLMPGLLWMSLFFLKIGATLFGSGYLLVNYLQSGLVDQLGWLTTQQLSDAIAVGQVTPGPLLTTATFIGFLLGHTTFGGGMWGGFAGALLATISIFLPSFLLVAFLGRLLPYLRTNVRARAALDAMNAVVVSLILVVTLRLAFINLSSWPLAIIAVICLLAMLFKNASPTGLILLSGLVGFVLR